MQTQILNDMHHLGNGKFCFKWESSDDVRSYRPPSGFEAVAECADIDPVTQDMLEVAEWWMFLNPGAFSD